MIEDVILIVLGFGGGFCAGVLALLAYIDRAPERGWGAALSGEDDV